VVREHLADRPVEDLFDRVLLPALVVVRHGRKSGELRKAGVSELGREKPYALITLKRSLRKLKALGLGGNSRNAPGPTSCARTSRCGDAPPARARPIPE
jgi:hypothetical protein